MLQQLLNMVNYQCRSLIGLHYTLLMNEISSLQVDRLTLVGIHICTIIVDAMPIHTV